MPNAQRLININPIQAMLLLTLLISGCQAKGCGNPDGTPAQATAIEDAMYRGSVAECVAAISVAGPVPTASGALTWSSPEPHPTPPLPRWKT